MARARNKNSNQNSDNTSDKTGSKRKARASRGGGSDRGDNGGGGDKPDDNAPITFIVQGQMLATPAGSAAAEGANEAGPRGRGRASTATGAEAGTDGPRIKASVRLSSVRAAAGEPLRLQAVPDEDLVVLHLADGPSLTLHPATARDLLLAQSRRTRGRGAAADPDEVLVPAELAWQGGVEAAAAGSRGGSRGASRGLFSKLGKLVLAGIDIVVFGKLDGAVADLAASGVVAKVDGQVKAGVYSLPGSGALLSLKAQPERLLSAVPAAADGGALLVLIHGTFVDTASTFAKLWQEHPGAVTRLMAAYQQRVYALDHPTLGESPIANALTLVQALPKGARLHLLTHSRGGLVAEVLARVAGQRVLSPADLALFAKSPKQQQELRSLLQAVLDKDLHVDRVVRVACPARGTLLASRRLDAYLSVLTWLLRAGGALVASELVDFLNAVARRRTDPASVPGLEAMMPGSALVQWLNRAEMRIPGELRVVAGDLQGDAQGGWFKTLLADAFYWTDNDIVVQTRSMYGGSPRENGAAFVLDQSSQASHFTYFHNTITVDAVVEGLTLSQPGGYRPIGQLSWAGDTSDGVRSARSAVGKSRSASFSSTRGGNAEPPAPSARPCVIVVPGLLGSNLEHNGQRIWLGLRLLGGLGRLHYQAGGADGVLPDGAVKMVYGALVEHLKSTHDVVVFDYDWRRPLEEEALRLAAEVEQQLAARSASNQPVRLLVHSMGGVLARTMQLEKPAVWQRLMSNPGARLVMLGTPNGGSWAPMQALTGDDTFNNTLTAVGSPFQDCEARQMMAEFPGFMQLQTGLLDTELALDREETWRRMAQEDLQLLRQHNWWHRLWQGDGDDTTVAVYEWGVPPQDVLDGARKLRLRLDAQQGALRPDYLAGKVLLVVGRAKFTPDGFEMSPDEGLIYRNAVDGGDGRVPLTLARLPDVQTWTLDADHGSMPSTKGAFAAFEDLLVQGGTERLQRLAGTRGAAVAASATEVEHVWLRPSRAPSTLAQALPAAREDELLLPSAGSDPTASQPRDKAAVQPLDVTVVNGNLSFNRLPLFIGHYRALSLTGTERVVDELVGGTLSTSLQLRAGSYPESMGTHQVFVNTRRDPSRPTGWASPPAAVVVGLGEEGKLTEAMLAASVRQAVLGWLQREAEERARADAGRPEPVRLAATLLGSGGFGISAGAAARAIVQGVVDANTRVASTGWPQVQGLELVELYLQRATEAWGDLRVLQQSQRLAFAVRPCIHFGTGPLRRPLDTGYRGAEYDFVRVTQKEGGELEFALDSRRARTEVRAQSTQAALVNELVATAADDRNSDKQLGRTLFQLLVPPAIEPYLRSPGGILLELDAGSAAIPWELLDTPQQDGACEEEETWALRTGLMRKLRVDDAGNQDIGRRDAIADDDVLVVGEPDLAGREGYGPLPAARKEALAVLKLMRERLEPSRVESSISESARPIINKLLQKRWRIIHLSGHGEASANAGVVLSGKAFLGPCEIRAMRTVPELVFLNCCHLAAPGQASAGGVADAPRRFNAPGFAAGVAEQLIGMGVRCVVAAGWAVDDDAACAFALRFYERLLDGANFGTAVAEARRAAKAFGGNTWGAYQCYGDPGWRYKPGVDDSRAVAAPLTQEYAGIASPPGLTLALEKLAVDAKWRHGSPQALLSRIGFLEGHYAPQWQGIGAVAEAFGLAYAEAGALPDAIRWYRAALICNDASASINASEKLGYLLAWQSWGVLSDLGEDAQAADFETARGQVIEALRLLMALTSLLPTVERHSLVGSAWKRRALVERAAGDAAAERDCTERMQTAYQQAVDLADQSLPDQWPRAAINLVAAGVRRHRLGQRQATKALAAEGGLMERLQAELSVRSAADPDFWSESGLIEVDLYRHLLGLADAPALPAVTARFVDLQRRAPSRSVWRSVSDQQDFVLGAGSKQKTKAEELQLLTTLRGFVL